MPRLFLISLVILVLVFAQFTRSNVIKVACGGNQVTNNCANACIATCEHPNPGLCMINPEYCEEGCKCGPGYVRETDASSKCIAVKDCPKPLN